MKPKYYTQTGNDILPSECQTLRSACAASARRAYWDNGPALVLDAEQKVVAIRKEKHAKWEVLK